jgi:hypothetical protein
MQYIFPLRVQFITIVTKKTIRTTVPQLRCADVNRDHRGRNRMAVGFITTYAISGYHL